MNTNNYHTQKHQSKSKIFAIHRVLLPSHRYHLGCRSPGLPWSVDRNPGMRQNDFLEPLLVGDPGRCGQSEGAWCPIGSRELWAFRKSSRYSRVWMTGIQDTDIHFLSRSKSKKDFTVENHLPAKLGRLRRGSPPCMSFGLWGLLWGQVSWERGRGSRLGRG